MLLKGLRRCDSFVQAVRQVLPFLFQSSLELRHRLRAVWRDVEGFNPQDTNSKLATRQSFFAVPFDLNVHAPIRQDVCIWICPNMPCRMPVVSGLGHTSSINHLVIIKNSLLCDRLACL